MRGDGEWDAALIRCLADCGVDGTEAAALARDALAEAEGAGCGPREMYGPAATYAQELARAFRAAPPSDTHLGIGPVVLRLSSVTKRYGRKPALRSVGLCLRAGQIAAVVGANGSGKSTLLDICAGLIRPTRLARTSSGSCPSPVRRECRAHRFGIRTTPRTSSARRGEGEPRGESRSSSPTQ